MQEVDEETKVPIVGSKTEEAHVYLEDKSVIPELRDKMIGKSKGDSFVFNPHDSDEHSPDKLFNVTIEEVQKLIPKEFTNEFVENYTKGKFKTTEEMREEIGFQLQEKWDIESRNALENQIIDRLVTVHEFDPPETVVEKVMVQMVEDLKKRYENTPYKDSISLENMRDDLKPIAVRTVKWEVIRNKIMEKEDLTVEDHDMDPIIEAEYQKMKTDKDTLKKSLMQNRQFVDSIMVKKIMDLLLDFSTTNEMTFDEYNEKYAKDKESPQQ
jgi:trigger factor